MQYNFKLGVWSLLAPSTVLLAFASPTYAEFSDLNKIETLAQAPNPEGDANRERFVQPPLNPQPLPSEPQQELPSIRAPQPTPRHPNNPSKLR